MISALREWAVVYGRMRRQAQQKRLLDPPPYADPRRRAAWRSGYEAALEDIARGEINAS